MEPQAAYDYCERVVKARARNFAYGIRLLPTTKRQALSAVYAFASTTSATGSRPAENAWPNWPWHARTCTT